MPTETDLSLKCDDMADDDFAAADGVDLRKPKKTNSEYKPGSGDDGGSSESGPAKPQLFPSSIGVQRAAEARWRSASDRHPGATTSDLPRAPTPTLRQASPEKRADPVSSRAGSAPHARRRWPSAIARSPPPRASPAGSGLDKQRLVSALALPPGTCQPGLCRRHRGRHPLLHQRAQEGHHPG